MYGIMADHDYMRDAIVFYDMRGVPRGAEAKRALVLPYEKVPTDKYEELAGYMNEIGRLKELIRTETEKVLMMLDIGIPAVGHPIKVTLPDGTVYEGDKEL